LTPCYGGKPGRPDQPRAGQSTDRAPSARAEASAHARSRPACSSRHAARQTRAGQDSPGGRLAYSVDEAARLTGLSRDLLYDEMRRGNLPYVSR
jgi:hypothetical protein